MSIVWLQKYQCIFFFLLASLGLQVGCVVFLSILSFINAMLSFFFLLIYYGEMVLDNFDVIFEPSMLGEVSSRVLQLPSIMCFCCFLFMKSVMYAGILLFLLSVSKFIFSVRSLRSSSSVLAFFFFFSREEFRLTKFVFSLLFCYFLSLDSDLQFYISVVPTRDKLEFLKLTLILFISTKIWSMSLNIIFVGNLTLLSKSIWVFSGRIMLNYFFIYDHFRINSKF